MQNLYTSLGWSNHRRWQETSTVRQVGTPPGGEREVCMTHRGTHASGGLATQCHYYASSLLANSSNAVRHGFRCSPAPHTTLLSLILLHSSPVTVSTCSTGPPSSSWRKAFYGHEPERTGEAPLEINCELCLLPLVEWHCLLTFYGPSIKPKFVLCDTRQCQAVNVLNELVWLRDSK